MAGLPAGPADLRPESQRLTPLSMCPPVPDAMQLGWTGRTHRLAVGRLPVHVTAGRPQEVPVTALVVGDECHHLPVNLPVRQKDPFHPSDLGQSTEEW